MCPKRPLDIIEQKANKLQKIDPAVDQLRQLVSTLIQQRSDPDFPLLCLEIVQNSIAPILNQQSKDNFLLAQQEAIGKNLCFVLLLAAVCACEGLEGVHAERNSFDQSLQLGTRNWISWIRGARNSEALKDLKTTHWSKLRPFFDNHPIQQPEDVTNDIELDNNIVQCFQDHEDMSCASTDIFDHCECCHISADNSDVAFYRCHICDLDLCANCEERRINYQ